MNLEFTDEEIDAVRLTKAQHDAFWETEIELNLGRVSYQAALFEHKYQILLANRTELRPPPKPLQDRVEHSRKDGIETIWYPAKLRSPRMVHGVASTPTIDQNSQVFISKGCRIKMPVPVRSSHKFGNIGEVVFARISDREVYVQATLYHNEAADYAWSLVNSGELGGFSVGSEDARLQAVVDGVKFYDVWRLTEVSICRRGANPDCIIEVMA